MSGSLGDKTDENIQPPHEEKAFQNCKPVGLAYLQAEVVVEVQSPLMREAVSTTKKKTFILPKFCGRKQ